jgi:hypothetical protein
MWAVLEQLVNANPTLSIISILLIVFGVIVAVVFLINKGKGLKDVLGGGNSSKESAPAENIKQNIQSHYSKDNEIHMSVKTFKNLLDSISNYMDDHLDKKEKLKEDLNIILCQSQNECIAKVVGEFTLKYPEIDPENDKINDIVDSLEYYLKVDLGNILNGELERLHNEGHFESLSQEDISNKVGNITSNVSRQLRIKINRYLLINRVEFIKLFESHISMLKTNIDIVVNTFIRETKENRIKILELANEKIKKLEEKLKAFVDVGDGDL